MQNLHIKQQIYHLIKVNQIFDIFQKKILENNNHIIKYLNLKDLHPKYINLESHDLDSLTITKSIEIEAIHFEIFDIPESINEPTENNNSINMDTKLLEQLVIFEEKLLEIQFFIDYLIETKNFYYKYQMYQCLVENIRLNNGILYQVIFNCQKIIEYESQLLEMIELKLSSIPSIPSIPLISLTPSILLKADIFEIRKK
jgi:hypothetical protein